jgi:hypothetical protein
VCCVAYLVLEFEGTVKGFDWSGLFRKEDSKSKHFIGWCTQPIFVDFWENILFNLSDFMIEMMRHYNSRGTEAQQAFVELFL